jgi:Lipase (class 3)
MPAISGPCPQAQRIVGSAPAVADPYYFALESTPILPRTGVIAPNSGPARVTPFLQWPYHLPSFNGIDCLYWAMLARASYWTDQTWVNNVCQWASPVLRISYVSVANPGIQGYALVELQDCVMIVIPGTSSEEEALQYIMRHSLENLTYNPAGDYAINSAWALRGESVRLAYLAWPPPALTKPIIVVGHSSGGAYGAWVTLRLDETSSQPVSLVTFGAPLWGTPSIVAYEFPRKAPKFYEFGNPNDPIMVIPPPWSVIDAAQLGYRLAPRPEYRRVGNVLLLGNVGRPTPTVGDSSVSVGAAAFFNSVTGQGAGLPHSTHTYTLNAKLWAENDPTLVLSGDWDNELDHLIDVYNAMVLAGA